MKKAFCILLSLCLLLSIAGCKSTPDPKKESEPTEAETESTINDDVVIQQRPMISVSVPTITDPTTADDGTEIFRYVYPSMNLVFPDADVANKVISHHRQRLVTQLSSVEEIRQMAVSNYSAGQSFMPYLYSVTYSPMRADLGVLSIYGNNAIYAGGAHPEHHGFGANYDMITGEVLTLGSILKHIDQKDVLRDLVISALDEIAQERHLFGYKDYVTQRFKKDESTDEDWFFTNNGIAFFFSPYEIAPYSEGTIIAEVPYSSLSGVIDDTYFPAERTAYYGTIREVAFADADLTKFTQTSELTVQAGGVKTLYYTDSAVHDFAVTQINPDTGYSSIIFYAPYLTPGDAVVIEVPAELKSSLTVTYTASNVTNTITY